MNNNIDKVIDRHTLLYQSHGYNSELIKKLVDRKKCELIRTLIKMFNVYKFEAKVKRVKLYCNGRIIQNTRA